MMPGNSIALDTNFVISFFNREESSKIALSEFQHYYLPVVVLGELLFGALNSFCQEANFEKIKSFKRQCTVLPIDDDPAVCYSKIQFDLKMAGHPIPMNDVGIAACRQRHELPLLSRDAHFKGIDRLTIVSF